MTQKVTFEPFFGPEQVTSLAFHSLIVLDFLGWFLPKKFSLLKWVFSLVFQGFTAFDRERKSLVNLEVFLDKIWTTKERKDRVCFGSGKSFLRCFFVVWMVWGFWGVCALSFSSLVFLFPWCFSCWRFPWSFGVFSAHVPGFFRVRKARTCLGVFEVFLGIFEKTKEKKERVGASADHNPWARPWHAESRCHQGSRNALGHQTLASWGGYWTLASTLRTQSLWFYHPATDPPTLRIFWGYF